MIKKMFHSHSKNPPQKEGKEGSAENSPQHYFQQARHWADDYYTSAVVSKNRWRACCLFVLLPILFLLLLCVLTLIPAQHLEPLLIHHYDNGLVTVVPETQSNAPKDRALIESELVRYVVSRESYSAESYYEQYNVTSLLSSPELAKAYQEEQRASNPKSLINILGRKGQRTVHIESVLFLEQENSEEQSGKNSGTLGRHNLAQINFTRLDRDGLSGIDTRVPLTALISWTHVRASQNPEALWRNWDGFMATQYTLQQRVLLGENNEN